MPDTVLVEEVGTEMTFMLPTHQGQLARFQEMFAHLEKQKYELGVSSYGVSDTTLEEVCAGVQQKDRKKEVTGSCYAFLGGILVR